MTTYPGYVPQSSTVPGNGEPTLHELQTGQGVLRWHRMGEGPPLLFLHGSGPGVTGMRNFAGVLPAFARHFECFVLEFPGFGVSDPVDAHPMQAAVQAVKDFLDGQGLERVDIIGNSMGGMAAVQIAIALPERVRRLVTLGGMGLGIFSSFPAEGINLLVEFTEDPTRERLRQWLSSMVYDQDLVTEELISERWEQATDPQTLASARRMYSRAAMKALSAQPADPQTVPAWAQLHRIKARTLLLWGRDDRVTPLDGALIPLRTIPDVELHVFPQCGHWAMIEQQEAFESTVLAFLNRPEAAL